MTKKTRDKIFNILANIEKEMAEIKELLGKEEGNATTETFDWNMLDENFNIDLDGIEPQYRVDDLKVKREIRDLKYRIAKSKPPCNGETLTIVLDFLKTGMKKNKSTVKVVAIITLLMEANGFIFGQMPDDLLEEPTWFKEAKKIREIYRDRILTYDLSSEFDWNKCLDGHFELNQRDMPEGYGTNIAEMKRSMLFKRKLIEEEKNAPKNGAPLNIILRYFRGFTSNRTTQKYCAIILLLM